MVHLLFLQKHISIAYLAPNLFHVPLFSFSIIILSSQMTPLYTPISAVLSDHVLFVHSEVYPTPLTSLGIFYFSRLVITSHSYVSIVYKRLILLYWRLFLMTTTVKQVIIAFVIILLILYHLPKCIQNHIHAYQSTTDIHPGSPTNLSSQSLSSHNQQTHIPAVYSLHYVCVQLLSIKTDDLINLFIVNLC